MDHSPLSTGCHAIVLLSHTFRRDEQVMRVPLIMRSPHAAKAAHAAGIAEHIDLFPTFCELAAITARWRYTERSDGSQEFYDHDLAVLRNTREPSTWRRPSRSVQSAARASESAPVHGEDGQTASRDKARGKAQGVGMRL